jgi:hypothetical protein
MGMRSTPAAIKGIELASGLGAIVLGVGIGLFVPLPLHVYALPLLAASVLVHGAGMSLKYRLETHQGQAFWWEMVLFWLCWAILAVLAAWLAWRLLT